jgi:tRNA modification GTPase
MPSSETIGAISTAPGRAAIGIVRVSGPAAGAIARQITGRDLAPRIATVCRFLDAHGAPIDEGIAVYFRAPRSYTGEDVLELQGHGGAVVLQLVLQRCLELGARVARPGEFTQRAFLNDRLDLAQAESVIDLIDATTAHAARCAVRSLAGEFSARVGALVEELVELRLMVEAALDFPEEEIDVLGEAQARKRLEALAAQLASVREAAQQGSLLRDGLQVVLVGQPNVGKSSLLNRLAGEELAIVTDVPGTTRDAIRQTIAVEGIPLHIVDTAGLRASLDPVERIGIERTWAAVAKADLAVILHDVRSGEGAADQAIVARLPAGLARVRVFNKIDLAGAAPRVLENGEPAVWLSARTGAGVPLLKQVLLKAAGWHGSAEGLFLARARHLEALERAGGHLERGREELGAYELFAEELRLAHRALCTITGEFTADDLLGEIFSRFCIGK